MTDTRANGPSNTFPLSIDDPELVAKLNGFRGELNDRMDIEITEATADRMAGTMPVGGNRQPAGLLHGGANAVLAESLGSMHAALLAPPGMSSVGIELNCSHHRAATSGVVTGVCTPIQVGRTLAGFDIVISDDRGRRTCTARLTCIYRPAG